MRTFVIGFDSVIVSLSVSIENAAFISSFRRARVLCDDDDWNYNTPRSISVYFLSESLPLKKIDQLKSYRQKVSNLKTGRGDELVDWDSLRTTWK